LAFGIAAQRIERVDALESAVREALATDAPALIVVPVARGSETPPWPFLHPAPHA